jgi:hypothetical protein
MGLDFTRLGGVSVADSASEPRRIFAALPAKDAKYSYARDVQSEVWERWHARRTERDLVVKMNTGGGKTVVGLLILKACLNEAAGPAAYITPDRYLAEQVIAEADSLGVDVVVDPDDARFVAGRAILVTNIYRLFNGKSVFGVQGVGARPPRDIGTFLIDDAHACLATVEDQFTLSIPAEHAAYQPLLDLLAEDLRHQSRTTFRDIEWGVHTAVMQVPYWAWRSRQDQVSAILQTHAGDEQLQFTWPLVADVLSLCRVAVSSEGFEIAPACPPIDRIPSFVRSRRRLYLTATLADDSVLVTHFAAKATSVARPITPTTADDLGDRMILTPQQTFPGTSDEDLKAFAKARSAKHNVVVLVPSHRRAVYWKDAADAIHAADTLPGGLTALRDGHVGLVVLVNKYDGIDLPGDACRVLVIDGLPEATGLLARLEMSVLFGSDTLLMRQVQRLEQGMGRGVRSNEDYCAVLLTGPRLASRLHSTKAREWFGVATRRQLELSDGIADQLAGRPFDDLAAVVEQCLSRDPGWVAASRQALDGLRYQQEVAVAPAAVARREAFDLARNDRYADASQRLLDVDVDDPLLAALLKQEAASYLDHVDPVHAQGLQAAARDEHRVLLRPQSGIGSYTRLTKLGRQADSAAGWLAERYGSAAELTVGVEAMLADLVPSEEPAAVFRFEQAMHDLALHIGLAAQRPERETNNGPDVLWALGDLRYWIIECKSGATVARIARHDLAQLSHSADWFAASYDESCSGVPVLVHPSRQVASDATARQGVAIMTFEKLAALRDAVREFATAAGVSGFTDRGAVARRLESTGLNAGALQERWTVPPR